MLRTLFTDETGQDLIEYALLGGFISLVALFMIQSLGTGLNTVYGGLNDAVAGIPPVG